MAKLSQLDLYSSPHHPPPRLSLRPVPYHPYHCSLDSNKEKKPLATKEEIKILAAKAELKAEQDKRVKLQTYYLSLFIGQSYFNNDGAQIYLIFQAIYKTVTTFSGLTYSISE